MILLAVVFAFGSALATAFSTSVQHLAAHHAPESAIGAGGLMRHLVRRPAWLVGQVLGIAAFGFHAVAMHHGPIALVQPIVICGIVLAVPLNGAMGRRWPPRHELAAVLMTAAALGTFLVVSDPSPGTRDQLGWALGIPVAGGVLVAILLLAAARKVAHATRRGFLLGTASGVLFGLVAVLLKATQIDLARDGWVGMLLSWPVAALVVAGVGGVAVNQLAYRTARLSASMPVLNVVDGAVAMAFGYLFFREIPRHSLLALIVEVIAVGVLVGGLWHLARYEAVTLEETDLEETAPVSLPL